MQHNRRHFIKTSAVISAGAIVSTQPVFGAAKELVSLFPHATLFDLPALGYNYDALEPYIDKQTMQIHHDKHHQAYVTRLNEAVEKSEALQHKSIEQLIGKINMLPPSYQTIVRNNGGGHWNHSFFWMLLKTNTVPSAKMQRVIAENFGSMESFKKEFEKAATSVFGSGWAWVIKAPNDKLSIITTANQDNPVMDIATQKGKPIMAVDVWEHAYYLKYQNKRADYLQAYWNVLNWNRVEELYLTK